MLGSTVNPFATGIASGFADVPISDGLGLRLVILVIGLAVGIWFVLRYADRVKRDPSTSLVYDMKEDNERHFSAVGADSGEVVLTGQHKVVLGLFGAAFAVMVYGVIPWEDLNIGLPTLWWWFPEMTASFLLFAILIGLVGRMREGELTSTFVDGARDLLGVALIIGIARGITVVMNNGQITDTVLHWCEEALGDVGEAAFAVVMYLLFLPLSFLIPSTSGLATVSMPIMAPLAEFTGVNPSLVVTAYQSASGLINLVTPTSAVVMGGLAIARVPYGRYLRFVWPLLLVLGRADDHRPRPRGDTDSAQMLEPDGGEHCQLTRCARPSPRGLVTRAGRGVGVRPRPSALQPPPPFGEGARHIGDDSARHHAPRDELCAAEHAERNREDRADRGHEVLTSAPAGQLRETDQPERAGDQQPEPGQERRVRRHGGGEPRHEDGHDGHHRRADQGAHVAAEDRIAEDLTGPRCVEHDEKTRKRLRGRRVGHRHTDREHDHTQPW